MFDILPCELNNHILNFNWHTAIVKNNELTGVCENKISIENIRHVYKLCKYNNTKNGCMNKNNDLLMNIKVLFERACRHGNIEVAKWLHELCNFTRNELMINNNFAFRYACSSGDIKLSNGYMNCVILQEMNL